MDDEPLEIRVIRRFINASGEKRVIFRSTGLYEWNAQELVQRGFYRIRR
jgi:hypothetical protein